MTPWKGPPHKVSKNAIFLKKKGTFHNKNFRPLELIKIGADPKGTQKGHTKTPRAPCVESLKGVLFGKYSFFTKRNMVVAGPLGILNSGRRRLFLVNICGCFGARYEISRADHQNKDKNAFYPENNAKNASIFSPF